MTRRSSALFAPADLKLPEEDVERHRDYFLGASRLDLSQSPVVGLVGDAGAEIIAQSTCLRELLISWNLITDVGAIHLASAPALTSLDLGGNLIGNQGAIALAQNTRLRKLRIESNRVGIEGFMALSQNTRLCSLVFHDNPCDPEERESLLAPMIRRNARQEELRRRNFFRVIFLLCRAWRAEPPFPREIVHLILSYISADQDWADLLFRSREQITAMIKDAWDSARVLSKSLG